MADQEAGREQIARAGRIDDALDRHRRHRLDRLAADDHAALLAARHHGELAVAAQRRDRGVEIGGLVEAVQFALVGEEDDRPCPCGSDRGIRRDSGRRRTNPTASARPGGSASWAICAALTKASLACGGSHR